MNSTLLPNNTNNTINTNNANNANPLKPTNSVAPAPIPAVMLTSQQQSGNVAPVYMSSSASTPALSNKKLFPTNSGSGSNVNTAVAGPDINSKAADVYQELQSGLGRVAIGNDTNVLDKINDFLTTYPQRHVKRNKDGQITPDTWIDMSVRDLFQQTIQVTIDIINDLSNTISDRQFMSGSDYRRKLLDIFMRVDRRLYVGLLLIFLSFVLYFIDSAT